MNDQEASEIMAGFGRAFFAKDRRALAKVLTEDAEWHFAMGADAPHGRVRIGVDGFMAGIEENDAWFERLRFENVVCRALDEDTILMTYMLDGRHRDGDSFELRGIELITLRGGTLQKKDVFWKQLRT